MNTHLSDWRAVAEEAARLGAAQLEQWRGRFSAREKAHADLVTEADHASQRGGRSFLQLPLPTHACLGEEDPQAKAGRVDPAVPTWIVDPLDGTANYVHDVPAFCVSGALMSGGEPVAGAVYDPRQDELFSAATGFGATLNGRRISVSPVT